MTTFALRRSAEALAAALLLAAPAGAAEVVTGAGLDWLVRGIFCAPAETGRREAPGTMSGWIHVPDGPVEMVAEGAVAPAVLGMGFGVRFQRAGAGLAELRFEVRHPPMEPGAVTIQSWESFSEAGVVDSIFFQFDVPEELVTGPWEFRAYAGGETLFRAPFVVVPGGEMPEAVALCRPAMILSGLGASTPG
jgi:hypothetical protein